MSFRYCFVCDFAESGAINRMSGVINLAGITLKMGLDGHTGFSEYCVLDHRIGMAQVYPLVAAMVNYMPSCKM